MLIAHTLLDVSVTGDFPIYFSKDETRIFCFQMYVCALREEKEYLLSHAK